MVDNPDRPATYITIYKQTTKSTTVILANGGNTDC